MAEKLIKTRLKLKYDTFANWEKVKTTFVPLKGEVCLIEVPNNVDPIHNAPSILFKVGDGATAFGDLKYGSALAADVYSWAKAANKPSYTAAEVGVTEAAFPGLKKVGTVTGVKINGTTKNPTSGVVDLGTIITAHQDISGKQNKNISDLEGITATTVEGALVELAANKQTAAQVTAAIEAELAKHPGIDAVGTITSVEIATGATAGSVKYGVNGGTQKEVAVAGLKSAAFTESSAYATAAQGTLATNALPKTTFDNFTKTVNASAIADAKAAGTKASSDLAAYETANDKKVSANTTAISNLQTAVASGITFKGKVTEFPTDPQNGWLVIKGTKEYIYDGTDWIELGDEGSHLTKATADTYYVPLGRTIAGKALSANISAADMRTALNVEDGATKVTKQTVTDWGFKTTDTTYDIATATVAGLVKSSTTGTTSGRDYKVQVNADGTMKVNVPWTDTNTNTAHAHSAGVGLIESGNGGVSGTTTYKAALVSETADTAAAGTGRLYAVKVDKNGKLAVNVPWTDNNTVTTVSTTANGGLKVAKTGNDYKVDIDDAITFVFDCGSSTEQI